MLFLGLHACLPPVGQELGKFLRSSFTLTALHAHLKGHVRVMETKVEKLFLDPNRIKRSFEYKLTCKRLSVHGQQTLPLKNLTWRLSTI